MAARVALDEKKPVHLRNDEAIGYTSFSLMNL